MKIGEYEFVGTCGWVSERYDVFDKNDNQVGYVCLWQGILYAKCPDRDGSYIYRYDFSSKRNFFESNEERTTHLDRIANAIHDYYHRLLMRKIFFDE